MQKWKRNDFVLLKMQIFFFTDEQELNKFNHQIVTEYMYWFPPLLLTVKPFKFVRLNINY